MRYTSSLRSCQPSVYHSKHWRSQNFAMGGVENDVTFDHKLYTGADSESFGGGDVILN